MINLLNKIKKMWFWAWNMRDDVDFDAHSIYDVLVLKLDRLYINMCDDSHCLWNNDENDNRMRKLNEARNLAKRLREDEYRMKAFYETDEKFEHYTKFIQMGNRRSRMRTGWKRHPERAKLYYEAKQKIYQKQKEHDKERFFMLLEKYIDVWWD